MQRTNARNSAAIDCDIERSQLRVDVVPSKSRAEGDCLCLSVICDDIEFSHGNLHASRRACAGAIEVVTAAFDLEDYTYWHSLYNRLQI